MRDDHAVTVSAVFVDECEPRTPQHGCHAQASGLRRRASGLSRQRDRKGCARSHGRRARTDHLAQGAFYADSALYNLAAKPIPTGGIINGFLMFHFPNIDYNVFYNGPLIFTLSFDDAFSHKYVLTRQTIGSGKWEPQMFPGIHMKVETKK